MRTLLQDRRTGERLEITGARNIDGAVEVVLGEQDDYGTAEYIRCTYKPAEPRRVRLALTTTHEFTVDEASLLAYFGEIPGDEQLKRTAAQWAYDGELQDFLDMASSDDDWPFGSVDVDVESKCVRHDVWRLTPILRGSSGCYRCDQEARA